MIISSNQVIVTYNEIEELFNSHLKREIEEWENEKNTYIKDVAKSMLMHQEPCTYMPECTFRMWLDLAPQMVQQESVEKLKDEIEKAGWKVDTMKFEKNDRTQIEQMFIVIRKA